MWHVITRRCLSKNFIDLQRLLLLFVLLTSHVLVDIQMYHLG
jgi:hypothetical protein